jgi:GH24 family phage-related lysozyme (muramidase)
MNEEQLNESVKDVVLALLSLAATSYEANYIFKQLEKRPEPVEQKIEALKIADEKIQEPSFDKTVEKLLDYYDKKVKVKLPHKPYPNRPTSPPSSISDDLINFIKKHEKFYPKPYWDYKQYSIGYGTKALPSDKEITEGEAERRLLSQVKKHRDAVINDGKRWGYKWTPDQIDALTSFRYNVGSLNQLTNNGKRSNKEISKKILEYNKAGGKTLGGLVNRRKFEHMMFLSEI